MPSWGPFLPLDDAPDPEFAMEHSGQGFITKELMIGMTSTESYNDFNAADIQARIHPTQLHFHFGFHFRKDYSKYEQIELLTRTFHELFFCF